MTPENVSKRPEYFLNDLIMHGKVENLSSV